MTQETINRIVKASGVSSGEMILLHFWGEDSDRETANRFAVAVAALGASPLILQQSRTVNQRIFSAAKESSFDDRYFALLSGFDAVLDIFAYQPIVLGVQLPEKQMALYRSYISRLFYQLMKAKRFTQIRIPTEANAAESGLEPQDYISRMTEAYDIDYDALKAECAREVKRYKNAEKLIVSTGENCTLQLSLGGRVWHIDAGDGDLPCGEIYIAPLELETQGKVFFRALYLKEKRYNNIILTIQNGEIIECSDPEAADYFKTLPKENRMVCEFGIGMNPKVTSLCGYALLDEKMHGTFHIAIGANDMFGGENKASDHIDFVGCGKIEVVV